MATYRPGQRTRDEIVRAARQLFFETGFHGVTVADIADASSCSKATVLYHFPSKVHVLGAVVEPVVEAYDQLRENVRGLDADETQQLVVDGFVAMVIEHRQAAVVMRDELGELLQHEAMAHLVRAGSFLPKALAGGRTDHEAQAAAMFAVHGAIGAAQTMTKIPDDKLASHLVAFCKSVVTPLRR